MARLKARGIAARTHLWQVSRAGVDSDIIAARYVGLILDYDGFESTRSEIINVIDSFRIIGE